jgi:predicted nucleic acid-binding protein
LGRKSRIGNWIQNRQLIEAVLNAMTIRPLESAIERVYASIRVALERKGTPIGAAPGA